MELFGVPLELFDPNQQHGQQIKLNPNTTYKQTRVSMLTRLTQNAEQNNNILS